MKGKELIFIEQNCVPVDILGSTHALSLNSHNNFWGIVLFDYFYFTERKNQDSEKFSKLSKVIELVNRETGF